MTAPPWEPEGIRFINLQSGQELLLVADGQPHAGWLCYRHREGQWVTLREATHEDLDALRAAQAEVDAAAGADVRRVANVKTRRLVVRLEIVLEAEACTFPDEPGSPAWWERLLSWAPGEGQGPDIMVTAANVMASDPIVELDRQDFLDLGA